MLIFYDCEVFKHDWMFVFILPETRDIVRIHNDIRQLKDFYELHKEDIWIGYNVRHYDQYILKGLLMGLDPYLISKHIIDGGQGWQINPGINRISLYSYDVMTTMHSLKELEGFMGNDIRETSVSFDIDRALTEQEVNNTFTYCQHDVEQTIEVFLQRKEDFDSHLLLLKTFNLPLTYISKTQTQLAAVILKATRQDYDDEFNISFPSTLRINKYWDVIAWYQDKDNYDYDKEYKCWVSDCPHVFAWGGLHGALDGYKGEGIILNIDVASYYPTLMIEYDYISRSVQNPELYREIYHQRLKFKAEKDPRQAAYKLVLNKTYGAMKYKFNGLYDPLMANNVCITGQLLLLDLIEQLELHWSLIQSNTDGLIGRVEPENLDTVYAICQEWEQRTRMKLEYEIFSKIFQKDVNNYIIIKHDGTYKSKGAYVKKLSKIDNNLPIVNHAVLEYFIHGTPVEETINKCNEIIMFQRVVKISNKFESARHGHEILTDKCLRVFASREKSDPGIVKIKSNGRSAKVENTPEHCFIVNGDIKGKRIPRQLDKEWYILMAQKRIDDFCGELPF